MHNQRLAWFLIGNLIGLTGLLLVVFASDAARRSSPEPVTVHSHSLSTPETPKPPAGEKP